MLVLPRRSGPLAVMRVGGPAPACQSRPQMQSVFGYEGVGVAMYVRSRRSSRLHGSAKTVIQKLWRCEVPSIVEKAVFARAGGRKELGRIG